MIVKYIRNIGFLGLITVGFLSGCSTTSSDPALKYQNYTAEQLFQTGEISLAKTNYSTASQQFEALEALYPFGENSAQAELNLMYAYYQNNDIPSAAAAAERFIKLYPRDPNVDYAYYMKGLADFTQNRGWTQRYLSLDISQVDQASMQQAFNDFAVLVTMFPDSRYAPDARQHMIFLRNLFAKNEFNIQQYYFQRGAYVASINRGNYILGHYDGTDSVEPSLVLIAKSYQALGLTEQMNQTLNLLRLNYPNDPYWTGRK